MPAGRPGPGPAGLPSTLVSAAAAVVVSFFAEPFAGAILVFVGV